MHFYVLLLYPTMGTWSRKVGRLAIMDTFMLCNFRGFPRRVVCYLHESQGTLAGLGWNHHRYRDFDAILDVRHDPHPDLYLRCRALSMDLFGKAAYVCGFTVRDTTSLDRLVMGT